MEEMTLQEFVEKIMQDKAFRREVLDHSVGYAMSDDPKGPEGGDDNEIEIGMWIGAGAKEMGYDFDADELTAEIKKQLDAMSGFKKFGFIGSIINAARKAKKAGAKAK